MKNIQSTIQVSNMLDGTKRQYVEDGNVAYSTQLLS